MNLKSFFFAALLLVAGPCLMQLSAQDVSSGVTLMEATQSDGTVVETIHISQLPSAEYTTVAGCQLIAGYDTLMAPPITLRLGEKMILKIDPSDLYDPYFYFQKQYSATLTVEGPETVLSSEEDDGPLAPELSSWLSCHSWAQEPYDHECSECYYQDWLTMKKGAVVLIFNGGTKTVDSCYKPIKLNVPVTVI